MDIDKLIASLEGLIYSYEVIETHQIYAINCGIEALRGKQERGKGCEYCTGWMIEATNCYVNLPPDGDKTVEVVFNYCPNCGRKLGD